MVDPHWFRSDLNLKLSTVKCSLSNHIPLLIESNEARWGAKPFRIIDAWFSHPGFLKLVEGEWKGCSGLNVLEKLRSLKEPLKKWNRDVFGNNDFNIERLEEEIAIVNDRFENGSMDEVDNASYRALKSQLEC